MGSAGPRAPYGAVMQHLTERTHGSPSNLLPSSRTAISVAPHPSLPRVGPLVVMQGNAHLCASGTDDGCFHVVVGPSRHQQPVGTTLEHRDARLGRQVVAAPADAVVLQGAPHPVVGHGTVLETD